MASEIAMKYESTSLRARAREPLLLDRANEIAARRRELGHAVMSARVREAAGDRLIHEGHPSLRFGEAVFVEVRARDVEEDVVEIGGGAERFERGARALEVDACARIIEREVRSEGRASRSTSASKRWPGGIRRPRSSSSSA